MCPLEHTGQGFLNYPKPANNGVLILDEYPNDADITAGEPFHGSAGDTLNKAFLRGGMERSDFAIYSTINCKPPQMKLRGMWYLQPSIDHCRQHVDRAVELAQPRVIIGLGDIAAKSLVPDLPRGILDARGYVFWSKRYHCWVINSIHPGYIMRGKTAWMQVLIHDLQRAVEIAQHGFEYATLDYTLDCTASEAHKWVDEFERYLYNNPDLYLSCDIETPDKRSGDEEDLDPEANEVVGSMILRCGYSYKEGHALSIPWDGPFRGVHERLLTAQAQHLWWNLPFDVPHINAQNISIGGTSVDGMVAFHILNSDLKKSLGFVAPFFAKQYPMWKHTSSEQPAKYNAMDADVAGINMRGTVGLLKQNGLWDVYQKFVVELDPVYMAMTRAGMPVDRKKRVESSRLLIASRDKVRHEIDAIVPDTIRPITPKEGYKKTPKDTAGLTEVVFNGLLQKYCSHCTLANPKKSHFKPKLSKVCNLCGGKWTPTHVKARKRGTNQCADSTYTDTETNPCVGAGIVEKLEGEKRWAKVHPFVPSQKGILAYQQAKKHAIIYQGRGAERRPTTNEKALRKLIGKHPEDTFYQLCLDDRELTKIGGSYIGWINEDTGLLEGGFPVGRDGRVRGTFTHNPSTLRSSMVNPSLQTMPRGNDSAIQALVKQMFVAPEGYTFLEADFKGIEARLVGYQAGAKDYYRLAGLDVHSYLTAYNLNRIGKLPSSDLPNLSWSDDDLMAALKDIKKRFPVERDIGKVCGHAGNYRVGPGHLAETFPQWFHKVKDAAIALGFYYELFPEIPQWHERICRQVDRSAIAKNSYGHVHRFFDVLQWEKRGNEWAFTYANDSKRLIAFGPQSDAALVGKAALKRLYYSYLSSMALWLRLFIHDSVFTEVPDARVPEARSILEFEMSKPIEEMPLDPSWGMGKYVTVGVEIKQGRSWSTMK